MRVWVQSLASLRGLRIQCCHDCGGGGRSCVAVAVASSCSSDSTSSPGTSLCPMCSPKNQKRTNKPRLVGQLLVPRPPLVPSSPFRVIHSSPPCPPASSSAGLRGLTTVMTQNLRSTQLRSTRPRLELCSFTIDMEQGRAHRHTHHPSLPPGQTPPQDSDSSSLLVTLTHAQMKRAASISRSLILRSQAEIYFWEPRHLSLQGSG